MNDRAKTKGIEGSATPSILTNGTVKEISLRLERATLLQHPFIKAWMDAKSIEVNDEFDAAFSKFAELIEKEKRND